jgi:small multidrug resistance pump
MSYIYLSLAIITEVIGTLALQSCSQFTKVLPSLLVVIGYGASFYFLSVSLKDLNIAFAYAIWSALGMVLIGLLGFVLYKQKLDVAFIIGTVIIIIGVCIICLFSTTVKH